MRKLIVLIFLFLFSCSPKPYYKTKEGKKKQAYYNRIQFGQDQHDKRKAYKKLKQ